MSTVKSKKIQLGTSATATDNFTIYTPTTPDGTLRIGNGNADNPTEIARFDSNGLNKLGTATGSAPSYSARAWALFNGTGTVSLTESGNVSSITDQGVGFYDVNFTTAMPDANFAAIASSSDPNYGTHNQAYFLYNRTTSTVRIKSTASNGSEYDIDEISVIVMR
jgi:hypothetical protein